MLPKSFAGAKNGQARDYHHAARVEHVTMRIITLSTLPPI